MLSRIGSEQEASYLFAILNAPVTTDLTRPLMSYGKDERDIHKHVWELPIPTFNPCDTVHARIAELGRALETLVATFQVNEKVHFGATRRHIREAIVKTADGEELNELTTDLISTDPVD
jgi:hypothetical protein